MGNFREIRIGNITHPIAFTAGTFARFERITGTPFFQFLAKLDNQSFTIGEFIELISCGIQTGYKVSNLPAPGVISAGTIEDFITMDDIPKVSLIIAEFMPKASEDATSDKPGEVVPQ